MQPPCLQKILSGARRKCCTLQWWLQPAAAAAAAQGLSTRFCMLHCAKEVLALQQGVKRSPIVHISMTQLLRPTAGAALLPRTFTMLDSSRFTKITLQLGKPALHCKLFGKGTNQVSVRAESDHQQHMVYVLASYIAYWIPDADEQYCLKCPAQSLWYLLTDVNTRSLESSSAAAFPP